MSSVWKAERDENFLSDGLPERQTFCRCVQECCVVGESRLQTTQTILGIVGGKCFLEVYS